MSELVLSSSAIAVGERLQRRAWIVAWWAAGRLLVLATAAVIHFTGPRAFAGRDERSHLLGLLGAWDGRWYRIVAVHGYLLEPGRQSDPAFFPLYPLLLRAGHALGIGYLAAGLVISNVAFLAALAAFEALTRELLGAQLARRATVYLAVFPLGFVFSMMYPESLVLCAIALTVGFATSSTVASPRTTFMRPMSPVRSKMRCRRYCRCEHDANGSHHFRNARPCVPTSFHGISDYTWPCLAERSIFAHELITWP